MNESTLLKLTRCRVCGEEKPSTDYYSDRSKKAGHGTECKLCVKARTRARYEADREGWIKRSAENKAKSPDRYRAYNRHYAQRNRERTAERESAYREEHRERYAQHKRNWYSRNLDTARERGRLQASARRAALAGNGLFRVTETDLSRALRRTGGTCSYCGTAIRNDLHWDHVMPVVRGGAHSIGNLVPACSRCNQSKSKSTVMEWRLRTRHHP